MSILTDPRIESLRRNAGEKGNLSYLIGENYLNINLLNENIDLWKQTFEQSNTTDNLLLACDKNSGDLTTTRLTWVAGYAIRGARASNATDAAHLLTQLGVIDEIAKAAIIYCPGLGEDLVWAFYLERHGWLTATPVARTKL